MSNILYRKQKQQKSLDNGLTWIDTGGYRVGDILENPSNCTSDDSKQCRWVELDESEGYYCDGYAKYTMQVEECSENGLIWTRTGNSQKGNTLIEENDCDCGYTHYQWNLMDTATTYQCLEGTFNKYGIEVYQVGCGENWQNVEPYQERLTEEPIECFSLDCGASSNEIAFSCYSIKNNYIKLLINNTPYTYTLTEDENGYYFGDFNEKFNLCTFTSADSMFYYDTYVSGGSEKMFLSITKIPDTTFVTDMSSMFERCSKLTSLDVSYFNTSNVTSMSSMFSRCFSLTSLDLSNFDVSNTLYFTSMFSQCYSLTTLNLSGWKFNENVTYENVMDMFYNCSGLTTLNLSGWYLPDSVLDEEYATQMFDYCGSLRTIFLNGCSCSTINIIKHILNDSSDYFDTSLIELIYDTDCVDDNLYKLYIDSNYSSYIPIYLNNTLYTVYRFNYYNLSDLNIENLTSVKDFAYKNKYITDIPYFFDTSNVTDMSYMFDNCWNLKYFRGAKYLNTSNVTNMSYMFNNCESLVSLNTSSWDISNVESYEYMFDDCISLTYLYIKQGTYDWWYARLQDAGIESQVTITEV